MKSKIATLFIGLVLLVNPGIVFADEPGETVDSDEIPALSYAAPEPSETTAVADDDQSESAQTVYFQPVHGQPLNDQVDEQTEIDPQEKFIINEYDWEHDAKIYNDVGLGFLFGGLALICAGVPLMAANHMGNGIGSGAEKAGIALTAIGGPILFTGIGLLIAEAVKFKPYRNGEIAETKFEWRPELFVSPEFSGLGLSANF